MNFFKKIKEKFSVNLRVVNCPECSTPQPRARKPENMREAMWGGNTCPECGCEMDKWGKKILG